MDERLWIGGEIMLTGASTKRYGAFSVVARCDRCEKHTLFERASSRTKLVQCTGCKQHGLLDDNTEHVKIIEDSDPLTEGRESCATRAS